MQKIIACEKHSIPCYCAEWRFDCSAGNHIRSVSAGGMPIWTVENGRTLCIALPVSVRLCDSCGNSSIRSETLNIEANLPRSFLCDMDDPRNTLLLLPCVRLLHAEHRCGDCFHAKLAITLEMFLLRYEHLCCGSPKPSCPQLPLYPPPIC